MFDYMPVEASEWAGKVDWINNLITNISVFCIVVITAVMLFFAIKYRRRSENQKTTYIVDSHLLETVWTVIPTLVVIFIFYCGFTIYKDMRSPPAGAIEINVEAQKWLWDFEYPNGKKSSSELVVPLGKAVRFIMKSRDVVHSFFIPAMRVKEDVVANRYSYLWFTPTKLGDFPIFCAEYCGLNHSGMLATLKVVSEQEYNDYLLNRTQGEAVKLSPVELGKQLYQAKGCNQCHSIDGSAKIGPSFAKIWGRVEHFEDGTSLTIDENYLHESIATPSKKIVKGFALVPMPSFSTLSDEEFAGLIAYLKTL